MGTTARLRRLAVYDALALTALVWFLAKFLRYVLPPLFATASFRAEFGVSNAVLGAAYTAMMVVYALMQFPSGALADRLGATRVVVGGALVAAGGALVLAVPVPGDVPVALPALGGASAGFLLLVAGLLLVGLGTGAHKTAAVRLLSRTYPARTGRALGVLDTVGALSGVAAGAAVVFFADVADWHALYLAAGVAGIGLAVAVALRVPRRVPDVDREAGSGGGESGGAGVRTYLALFGRPRFAAFVGVTLCVAFAYNGAVAFLPLYLTEQAGLAPATASFLYSVLFAVSFVQLVTGDLSDRVGRLSVLGGTTALAAVGLVALLAVGTAGPVVLGATIVAFGAGGHGYRPVRAAYLTEVIPDDLAGGGLGVVRTVLMIAGAVAPAVVGAVADATDFGVAFAVLAAAMVGAVALTALTAVLDGE
ncbi:MFS transporter [Halorarum halophilum]|uniref:MFS transporter n=1 Tax=Halorarum halophilum TaxID=2743090 RepID=A0A7D5KGA6_9EURY|nr:MFS transporter [Halobaculum halophilum]QLG28196.1 MFS transporter [Halobaculum halophilum]